MKFLEKIDRREALKLAGYLGFGLLITGYLRYSIQEVLDTINMAILIAGGVLFVAGVAFSFRDILSYFRRRSSRLGANTAVVTIAVLAILVVANFLGYKHKSRIDVTTEKVNSVSDQTRKIVTGLQKDVRVIKFDESDDPALRDLMVEYRSLSGRISYERIDPQEKLDAAKQYNVTRMGEVVVASGERIERPEEAGEQQLTNAILKVTRDELKTICFVEGHGEKKLSSMEGDGYGIIDKALKNENYLTKTINLVAEKEVPSDCDVLVLAGPKQSLFPGEAATIGKYLDRGGKAFLLIDPEPADPQIADVLKAWNIELGTNVVLDFSGPGRFFGASPAMPLVLNYGSHAITKDFDGTMTFFPFARSVESGGSSRPEISTTELLKTSDGSWAETELRANEEPKLDEGKDKKGPITIGVAASKSVDDNDARLVIIGDSDFAMNGNFQVQRNGDLFLNTVNWLAQDEELISIRPKTKADRRVTMTASQQNFLFWLTILLMPGTAIGSGLYIWWNRR